MKTKKVATRLQHQRRSLVKQAQHFRQHRGDGQARGNARYGLRQRRCLCHSGNDISSGGGSACRAAMAGALRRARRWTPRCVAPSCRGYVGTCCAGFRAQRACRRGAQAAAAPPALHESGGRGRQRGGMSRGKVRRVGWSRMGHALEV